VIATANSHESCGPKEAGASALIVICGDDVYEDLFTASLELQDILIAEGFVARVRMGLSGAVAEADREDLIVLYRAMGEFPPAHQAALAEVVRGGAGLLALHSSNVFGSIDGELDESYRTAFELIGSRYVSHGEPPHESRFTIRLGGMDVVTNGIEPFELTHEHYRIETRPAVDVVAWRATGHGAEPLVHLSSLGDGRVCYIQFGHDMRVWREPSVRQIIARSAEWARRRNQGALSMALSNTPGGSL
jgi:type 1 glutamine amidotransferase